MLYTENYRGVAINLVEDKTLQRYPNGSPDHLLIRLMPTLNGYTDSYISNNCGAGFPLPLSLDPKQTQEKILEVRENVLAKLHSYIDRVQDNSQSVPWLKLEPAEDAL